VTAPTSVVVPAGAVSVSVPLTIDSISQTTPVVLTSTYNGGTQHSPVLFVNGTSGVTVPLLSALNSSASQLTDATYITGTVTITSAAPTGGTKITLSSSNTAVLTVPSSVTVLAGNTAVTFLIRALSPTASTTAVITVTLNGECLSIPITVNP
jgi:hypothetical protein